MIQRYIAEICNDRKFFGKLQEVALYADHLADQIAVSKAWANKLEESESDHRIKLAALEAAVKEMRTEGGGEDELVGIFCPGKMVAQDQAVKGCLPTDVNC